MKHLGVIQDEKDLVHKGYVDGAVNTKQEKLAGYSDQLLGFDDEGNAIPVDEITDLDLLKIWNGGNE